MPDINPGATGHQMGGVNFSDEPSAFYLAMNEDGPRDAVNFRGMSIKKESGSASALAVADPGRTRRRGHGDGTGMCSLLTCLATLLGVVLSTPIVSLAD